MDQGTLRLLPLRTQDEAVARAAHAATTDHPFLVGTGEVDDWTEVVRRLQRLRRAADPAAGLVRSAFLVAWVDGEVVGRASIRFELDEYLAHAGGHIGYAVVPSQRRKGHATEILRQSLVVLRSEGVEDALVACAVDNVGSQRVIERCGGVLEAVVHDDREEVDKRRYRIR